MEKKIIFLVACLAVALLCSVPQVVSAYDNTEGYDEELVVGSDAEEPEYDDDEEFDEDEGYEQDGEADEEGGEYEEEDYGGRY